jgi:hypothetical protein
MRLNSTLKNEYQFHNNLGENDDIETHAASVLK